MERVVRAAITSRPARAEAQCVIAFRLIRLAASGALAESEAFLIVTEKVEALGEAQAAAAIASIKGRNSSQVAEKALGVYKTAPAEPVAVNGCAPVLPFATFLRNVLRAKP